MKNDYAPTSLGQFLNENKSITLTRKYGHNEPVVVGTRGPVRNQILSYVAENAKVTQGQLRKFIAGINEDTKTPAAVSMWMKRNQRYFVTENKSGVTYYKLSPLGTRLANIMSSKTEAITESEDKCGCGTKKPTRPTGTRTTKKSSLYEEIKRFFDEEDEDSGEEPRRYDFMDKGRPGLYDVEIEECDESDEGMIDENFDQPGFELIFVTNINLISSAFKKYGMQSTHQTEDNIKYYFKELPDHKFFILVNGPEKYSGFIDENMNVRMAFTLEDKNVTQRVQSIIDSGDFSTEEYSAMDESRSVRLKKIVEQIKAKRAKKLLEADEVEEEDELSDDDLETEEVETEETEETEETDDDKVEITDFVISVDNIEEAIAELEELGIPAERVTSEPDMEEPDMEEPEEENTEDFDLDIEGEIEGEEEGEETEEVEEGDTGEMDSMSEEEESLEEPITEDEEESLEEPIMEDDDELDLDLDSEDEEDTDLDLDSEDEEDTDLDLDSEDEEPAEEETEEPAEGDQIKVSAEHWDKLKGWLESKGVDIKDTFGEIEVEGEVEGEEAPAEGEDGEISFDDIDIEEEGDEEGDEEEVKEDGYATTAEARTRKELGEKDPIRYDKLEK